MRESIILLILRLIYIEEQKKLTDNVIVSVEEIYDRYFGLTGKRLGKTDMRSAMGLMKRYNIIRNIDADMGNPDARIQIYISVTLATDSAELNKESTMQKLNTYIKENETNENEENFDETETD